MPRVSVVVPSYNNAAFIADTLRSILQQSMRDLEVIVADHSSTDGTAEIVATFLSDPRVRLIHTEAGGGAARNWNRASQAAGCDLLKLVCGDDLLHPDALESQVAALDAHPEAVLVASQRRIVDARGKQVIGRRGLGGLRGTQAGPTAIGRSVVRGSNIFGEPACVLMRRNSLDAAGWWNADFPYLIDQATYARLLSDASMVALPSIVADFRLSQTQWSVDLASEQFAQVRGFHSWARSEHPEAISAADVRLGNARAGLMALSRRALYALLGRRMHAKDTRSFSPTVLGDL